MSYARLPILTALLSLSILAASPLAGAQQVYRSVGPDGRISFSDRPPAAIVKRSARV